MMDLMNSHADIAASPAAPNAAGGTQSLERAIALLRAVADAETAGARLADQMTGVGLSKATAHPLLMALARDGLVDAAFPHWRARFSGESWCIHRDNHSLMEEALAGRANPGCGLLRNPEAELLPGVRV